MNNSAVENDADNRGMSQESIRVAIQLSQDVLVRDYTVKLRAGT